MTKNLDFSALSLQDALDLAVLVEEEACERYQELAEQMRTHHTPEAAQFFELMVKNEAKHGQDLSKRRKSLFGDAPRTVDRSMLWEVEAPEYDQVRAFMSARQALQVALESEEKAHRFFDEAITHVHHPDVRHLFEELREEELLHRDLVMREMAKLAPEEPVDMSDFVDEPVAQ